MVDSKCLEMGRHYQSNSSSLGLSQRKGATHFLATLVLAASCHPSLSLSKDSSHLKLNPYLSSRPQVSPQKEPIQSGGQAKSELMPACRSSTSERIAKSKLRTFRSTYRSKSSARLQIVSMEMTGKWWILTLKNVSLSSIWITVKTCSHHN